MTLSSTLILAATLTSSAALAQAPTQGPVGPAAEVQTSYKRLRDNILKAADKMPAADYSFKPTPDIRSYARVLNHVTEAQFHACTALNGTKFEASSVPNVPADPKPGEKVPEKEALITALKASFAECDKAYAGLTDASMAESIQMGPIKRSRTAFAWGNVSHDNEQYATLSLYLRLKGLVPPTSEK